MANKHSIAQAKYDQAHCRFYGLKLNQETDADIIEKLSSVPSMQGYIKELIRRDISESVHVPSIELYDKKTGKTRRVNVIISQSNPPAVDKAINAIEEVLSHRDIARTRTEKEREGK